jgi:hypothetical protein
MKNNQKGSAPLMVVTLIVLVFIIGASINYARSTKCDAQCRADIRAQKNATSTPAITKDWKIYTNSQLGFSLQYPKNYTFSDACARSLENCPKTGTPWLVNIGNDRDSEIFGINYANSAQGLYDLELNMNYSEEDIEATSKFTTLEEFHTFFKSLNGGDERYTVTTFAGETAYAFTRSDYVSYDLKHGEFYYHIWFNPSLEGTLDEKKIMDKMVTSFKFTK